MLLIEFSQITSSEMITISYREESEIHWLTLETDIKTLNFLLSMFGYPTYPNNIALVYCGYNMDLMVNCRYSCANGIVTRSAPFAQCAQPIVRFDDSLKHYSNIYGLHHIPKHGMHYKPNPKEIKEQKEPIRNQLALARIPTQCDFLTQVGQMALQLEQQSARIKLLEDQLKLKYK